ncbi:MAG: TIGR01459 family HAD-type hydrolase, partial [Pseudomonadota bacterium]
MSEPVVGLSVPAPPVIDGAGPLFEHYDVIFCDVWGVVHDGVNAHFGAQDALRRFRDAGGTVVLVSNAPVPKARVATMLADKGFPEEAWDDIVSSGDIALRHIGRAGYKAVHAIGPRDRDSALFNAVGAEFVALDTAEAIICTGLNDDLTEVAADYDPLLKKAYARKLPFI